MLRRLFTTFAFTSGIVALTAVTPALAQSAAPLHRQIFDAADVDADGLVSRLEYEGAVAYVFARLDTDNSATLSRYEFARPGLMRSRRFYFIDKNNDGVIVMAEIQAFESGRFGAIDANNDEVITRAEADLYVTGAS